MTTGALTRLTYLAIAWSSVSCDCGSDVVTQPNPFTFEATLSGSSVVPPVVTPASGSAIVQVYDSLGWHLQFVIRVSNLQSADSANLHVASNGANGPAHAKLCATCTTASGVLARGIIYDLSPSVVTSMRAFGTYIEIRNAAGPMLRGQLRVVAGPSQCS